MYYRHNLNYQYPEKSDAHMIEVKHLRDVNLDEQYPYLQKSMWFRCQRGILRLCQYTVLPIVMKLRHGLRIHGKEKLKLHRDLLKDGMITVSNHVFMWDYICIMVAAAETGIFPGMEHQSGRTQRPLDPHGRWHPDPYPQPALYGAV
jgi:hypothetical protein